MKEKLLIITAFIVIYLNFPSVNNNSTLIAKTPEENKKEASINYLKLRRLHLLWSDKKFGKGPYYRRVLYYYLIDLIRKEILTDYSYTLTSPESIFEAELTCQLYNDRWLKIRGKIKKENIKKIIGDKPEEIKEFWRGRKLLAVYGKIRDFKLSDDGEYRYVTLYLDNIILIDK